MPWPGPLPSWPRELAGTLLGNINGLNISVGYLGLLVLPAVVLGGLNSVPGAIVGGMVIGVLQNLADGYLSRFTPGGVKDVFPFRRHGHHPIVQTLRALGMGPD